MQEGPNGRYYYDYAKGTCYEIHNHHSGETPVMVISVNDMFVSKNGEEVYIINRELVEGSETFAQWTKLQLEIYLEMSFGTLIAKGEPVEYPLTVPDVKHYFWARKKARNTAIAKANKILIGVPEQDSKGKPKRDKTGKIIYNGGIEEYRYLLKEQEQLERILSKRYARNQYAVNQESMYKKKCARRLELIKEKGLSVELFFSESLCPKCKNYGVDAKGNICRCALDREEEIKSFCASERLKKKLSETWADKFREENTEENDDSDFDDCLDELDEE